MHTRLTVNQKQQRETRATSGLTHTFSNNALWVGVLSAGTHYFDVQYRVNDQRRFRSDNDWETRALQVVPTCGVMDPVVISPTSGMLSNQPNGQWVQMPGLDYDLVLDEPAMVLMRYQIALRAHYTHYGGGYEYNMRVPGMSWCSHLLPHIPDPTGTPACSWTTRKSKKPAACA